MKPIHILMSCALMALPAIALAQANAPAPGAPAGQEPALTPGNGLSSSQSGTTLTNQGLAKVWVRPAKSRYFCPGDKRYGIGKRGAYMSEADARNAGDRPAHGRACT